MTNKPKNTSLEIWCEGESEKNYFDGLIEEIKAKTNKNLHIKTKIPKSSYKNIKIALERNPYYDKLMIVLDLDRANQDIKELKNLESLIAVVRKNKENVSLFLSYANFEDWLLYHFVDSTKNRKENLYLKFGKQGSTDFKRDTKDIYKKIQAKGGDIANAEEYFSKRGLFLTKDLSINKNNKNTIQSNLYCFRAELKRILNRDI